MINRCCDLVQLFRWTIAQSCRVTESEYWNLGVPLTVCSLLSPHCCLASTSAFPQVVPVPILSLSPIPIPVVLVVISFVVLMVLIAPVVLTAVVLLGCRWWSYLLANSSLPVAPVSTP